MYLSRRCLAVPVCALSCLLLLSSAGWAQPNSVEVTSAMHHLRVGQEREWVEFPEVAEGASWNATVTLPEGVAFPTLRWRQQDVKQVWTVHVNDQKLAPLERDENDMVVYATVPEGLLQAGENRISIEGPGRPRGSDDIRVGEMRLYSEPRDRVLSESRLQVTVSDEAGSPLPARITVVNSEGTLQSAAVESNDRYAVRPGTIYTLTGTAEFGVPAGTYTIYAGRGFEYSLAQMSVTLEPGEHREIPLTVRREVPTEGYVACDTHVHTLTHSGHGDATVTERMVTLAAEGIELPVATDHNVQIDHRPFARQLKADRFFTPVIGNEVTTPVAHFNVFPVAPRATPPPFRFDDLNQIYDSIFRTPGVRAVILNHARDVHSGVTPFGPQLHLSAAGIPLPDAEGRVRPLRANAMEVLNSSATQTDPMQLLRDWMALLNRGYEITPVGSSDSHDVARHFVGQGRTYIRCDDSDPGNIDIERATDQFLRGAVMVSYGLAVEMTLDQKFQSGDVAQPSSDRIQVSLRVLGPHWVRAERIELYANGRLVRSERIASDEPRAERGVVWQGVWELETPEHDVVYVAIARGPGEDRPFWRAAKPYQPDSPEWTPTFVGCSGAIRLDADRDGKWQSALDYAATIEVSASNDFADALKQLSGFDTAVGIQFAHLYHTRTGRLLTPEVKQMVDEADPHVRAGLHAYANSLRESVQAGGNVIGLRP